jgi:hypothetical protein
MNEPAYKPESVFFDRDDVVMYRLEQQEYEQELAMRMHLGDERPAWVRANDAPKRKRK